MSNERILSHKMSKKLDLDEIKSVPAGGSLNFYYTQGGTQKGATGSDGSMDCDID